MIRSLAPHALALAAAIALSSCANDASGPAVLAKSSASRTTEVSSRPTERSNDRFQVATPSESLVAAAASRPKDRHKMPVYSFTDRTRLVRTTAYTHTEADHLIYGNKNAAGTTLRYNDRVRSAAADWSFYPVGTVFRIKGMPHLYVVDDYGSALTGTATVDLYKPSMAVMNEWGLRQVELTVVQWGSMTRSAEILSHRTQHAHCARMFANIVRQRPELASLAKR